MNRFSRYIMEIPDAHFDCALFAGIAFFIFAQSYFGGDEAAKFLHPTFKFWLNGAIGGLAAICGAIKMFRSTAYAALKEKKEKVEDSVIEETMQRRAESAEQDTAINTIKHAAEVAEVKAEIAAAKADVPKV